MRSQTCRSIRKPPDPYNASASKEQTTPWGWKSKKKRTDFSRSEHRYLSVTVAIADLVSSRHRIGTVAFAPEFRRTCDENSGWRIVRGSPRTHAHDGRARTRG